MVRPERRTKADVLAAATIAVVVAVTASLIWWTSDARATISRPAAVPAPNPSPAREVPATLKSALDGRQPATTAPVVAGGTVTTGNGRQVDGRDPATGQSRWSYCARQRTVRGVLGLPLRRRGLSGRPRLRAGQHARWIHRPPWARAQQLRRSAGAASPPTARRCCRPVKPGSNYGARTWSGCWPTARPTPG